MHEDEIKDIGVDISPERKRDGAIMIYVMMAICFISLMMALWKCLKREGAWRFAELSFGDFIGISCLSLGFLFASFLFWSMIGLAVLKYMRGHDHIDMPISYSELDNARQEPQHWSVGTFVSGCGAAILYMLIINY